MIDTIEAYSQIVGLISAFSSGRDFKKALEIAEFNQWLIDHNHNEIVRIIESSRETEIFVKAFLNRELPQIQLKLDTLVLMVETLIQRQDSDVDQVQVTPLNQQYVKRTITFLFERYMYVDFDSSNFEYLFSELTELLDGHEINYNPYVLESMLRECLQRRDTATTIVNKHWYNLLS